jgi:hypothetical protein
MKLDVTDQIPYDGCDYCCVSYTLSHKAKAMELIFHQFDFMYMHDAGLFIGVRVRQSVD